MELKWFIAIAASLIFVLFWLHFKPKKQTGWIPDLASAFDRIALFIFYLIFWIIWLIIF